MNKRKYTHLSNLIYRKPWYILADTHREIQKQFEKYIQSETTMPMDDDEMPHEEADEMMYGNTMVIPINGPIGKRLGMMELCFGGYDLDWLNNSITTAKANDMIENVILWLNTPGGAGTGLSESGQAIANLAKDKKVIAYTDTICASAGYWLASQANYIYAAESADIGSVGVYLALMDASRAYEKEGLKPEVFSAGKFKTMGADWKPLTDEERQMLQAEVDRAYNKFKTTVLSKRDIKDEYLQGQVFDGEQAVEIGFIDGVVNDIDELIEFLK